MSTPGDRVAASIHALEYALGDRQWILGMDLVGKERRYTISVFHADYRHDGPLEQPEWEHHEFDLAAVINAAIEKYQ